MSFDPYIYIGKELRADKLSEYMCVSATWSKSNLHSIYKTKPRIRTFKQKTCPRQLSRIIAMDSTKSQNKFLRVLIFISTLWYMKLVINAMKLKILLGLLFLNSNFTIFILNGCKTSLNNILNEYG